MCLSPSGVQTLISSYMCFSDPHLVSYKGFACQTSRGKAGFPSPDLVHSLGRMLQARTQALLANPLLAHACIPGLSTCIRKPLY